MKKHRIYWPYGNPQFDAWEIESRAGQLVVRRNHSLIRGKSNCQGWDIWLGNNYLGVVGSCSLTDIAAKSRHQLKVMVMPACCSRHTDFSAGLSSRSRPGWGGRREGAGRPLKAKLKRVDLATTIDRRTLELIDQNRGEASRGEYLDLLVQGKNK